MRTINLSGPASLPDYTMFVLFRGNEEFLQRRSRRLVSPRESTIYLLLGGALFCLFMFGIWALELNEWVQLSTRGQAVQGVVTGHRTKSKGSVYYVRYQYDMQIDGRALRMRDEDQVPYDVYQRLDDGAQVTVRYLPDAPQVSRLEWTSAPPLLKMAYVAGAALAAGFLVLSAIRKGRELRLLQREGLLLQGQVLGTYVSHSSRRRSLNIAYEFTTPDQQTLSDEDYSRRSDLLDNPPAPGTPVAVLYISPKLYQIL